MRNKLRQLVPDTICGSAVQSATPCVVK